MYKRNSLLKEPGNSLQKLWRFLKYERLLEMINDNFLYFTSINRMNDQWEGVLTEKTKNKLFKQEYLKYNNTQAARGSVEQYEKHKDSFYINCWHMNDHESYLMWRTYGERGCAIQTNYERLVASFESEPPEINGCVISYIDYERDHLPIGNVFYPVSYKDLAYQDEKEFRLLFWKLNLPNQSYQVDNNGVKVKIDMNMLIDNIYINPTKQINIEKLMVILEKKKINCEKLKFSRIRIKE
jgi:hypothetical protein